MAWLRAVPKESKLSRWQQAEAAGRDINLPPVDNFGYLIKLLDEAGTCTPIGMGVIGLSWNEIKSWMDCMGLDLSYWEISLLRDMSREYASQANNSEEPTCRSPYLVDKEVKTQEAIVARSNEIKNLFRKFMKTKED